MPIVRSYCEHKSPFRNGNISRDLIFNTQSLPYRGRYQAFKHNELRDISLNVSFYFIYFPLFMHFMVVDVSYKCLANHAFLEYFVKLIVRHAYSQTRCQTNRHAHSTLACTVGRGEKKHYLTPNP